MSRAVSSHSVSLTPVLTACCKYTIFDSCSVMAEVKVMTWKRKIYKFRSLKMYQTLTSLLFIIYNWFIPFPGDSAIGDRTDNIL